MRWVTHRLDLPDWLFNSIGKVAAEWSELEWQFEDAIRIMLETDIERGRIITVGMSMRSRTQCLINLIQSKKPSLLSRIESITKEITEKREGDRNKFVHGLYGKIGRRWVVLRNMGSRHLDGQGKVPRAVLPQGEAITQPNIGQLIGQLRDLRQKMISLRNDLRAAMPPSPHITPEQHQAQNPIRVRKPRAQ